MEDVKWLDERLDKIFKEAPRRDGGGVEDVTKGVEKASL